MNKKSLLWFIPLIFASYSFGYFVLGPCIEIDMAKDDKSHLLIYVAGKYSDSNPIVVQANINAAIEAGDEITQKCNYPIVPHLWGVVDSNYHQHSYQFWMMEDKTALEKSDAMLFISHSKGADIELSIAKQLGIPIYYDANDVPNNC
jgi:hypothetical protein